MEVMQLGVSFGDDDNLDGRRINFDNDDSLEIIENSKELVSNSLDDQRYVRR